MSITIRYYKSNHHPRKPWRYELSDEEGDGYLKSGRFSSLRLCRQHALKWSVSRGETHEVYGRETYEPLDITTYYED